MQSKRGSSGSFAERTANRCWKAKCRNPGSASSWQLCRAAGVRRHALDRNLQLGLFVRAWPKPRGELAPLSCRSCCQESVAFSAGAMKVPRYRLDRSCVPLVPQSKEVVYQRAMARGQRCRPRRTSTIGQLPRGTMTAVSGWGIDGAPTGIRTALVHLPRAEAVRFFHLILMPSHASLRAARQHV